MNLGLVDVDGGADVEDRGAIGGDEGEELQHLIEVALCRQRYGHNSDL